MLKLKDVIGLIEKSELKRDFTHELSPANKKLFMERGSGSFEAVLTGRGNEKCLIPEVGTLYYLFRGQNEEYVPCVPSLYRNNPSNIDIFIERMRYIAFKRLLESHPVVSGFFKKNNFIVDVEGLAQHYGLKTSVLDLTSSLNIAMFFAVCKCDDNGSYHFYNDGLEHDAILYVFDPILDNEPCPPNIGIYLNHNITPIGLQAFPRPGIQQGYALHIEKGESTKSCLYRFSFTCEDSKYYYDMFNGGDSLLVVDNDILISISKKIAELKTFPYSVFQETFDNYRPKGFSKSSLKKCLPKDIVLLNKKSDIVFSDDEKAIIKNDWNNNTGEKMASLIRRKPWFEHDEVEKTDNNKSEIIKGIKNNHDFRDIKHISETQILNLIASPDNPEGAEWKNYTGKPMQSRNISKDSGKWIKVPARMENVFGKKYLLESDWKI